ncbi:MAG: DUF488 family protein [Paracoccus sp. (in: a-proteobacteria)]|uniref:DUF488 domain-containing protein n=1 Tax=Paracoccus sp. TaxID=267 RepID=UPI0026E06E23|nr:DUF488 family protein [Paracoccus sp. (in: a-proteobacteria)]MDO5620061.1 DUF488 family protein [Paracoccus sp. (in: a-proteobacteria)]
MQISVKRAYDPPAAEDGVRVLVDRLWPRGVSKDHAALAEWLRDIAPSDALRHWFDHDPAKWAGFQQRYRAELDANPEAVRALRALAAKGPVTLIYAAHDEEHNNAVVLRDYLLDG